MCEFSVIVPVRDEEQNIDDLVQRISATLDGLGKTFEILFVTDINTDNTTALLEKHSNANPNVKAIVLSNSFGQHVAVMAGLDHSQGECTVIMDGDLQDYPEDIPLLYHKLCEGYDVVYATKSNKNSGFFRNLSSLAFNSLMNSLSDIKINSNSSMFRIISRKARQEVTKFREHEPSLTYIFSFINLPTTTVEVRSGVRQGGKTKYDFLKLMRFATSSLLSFSRKPVRMISNFGLIVSMLSFLYLLVVLYQYFFLKITVLGWATIIVIITFIGGIQLLSIGIIGEYIGRIYMQTKNRPLYVVEKRLGDFE